MFRQITFTLPPAPRDPDLVSAFLALAVPHGWEEQSLADGRTRYIIHSQQPDWCSELVRDISGRFPDIDCAMEELEEKNWLEAWKEFFSPVQGGEHFLVLAPWMLRERAETERIALIIEPKTAFGTGHHASTALCLEALSRLFAEGRLSIGMRFLDLGTGTGILGIAAALLGLRGEGLDIDPLAVDNALDNREANGLSPASFRVDRGDLDRAQGPYQLVLANILAGPLLEMAPRLAEMLSPPSGALILSGILDTQAEAVTRAYTARGFPRPRRLSREEWTALVFA
ncbi:MAG: 50S ribosomal protein L11 methyltransferase [Deltaproteobacteria bacterium]|jgi:ribosomal protein L11 methyltransferase|nr:50S ribosomal protein L11 methyltransferase [Deltaproteobacteria bacterium]